MGTSHKHWSRGSQRGRLSVLCVPELEAYLILWQDGGAAAAGARERRGRGDAQGARGGLHQHRLYPAGSTFEQ